jgi:predicted glycoside hydrolase/deacetylase ChbG (UPF0249 family)
VKHLIVNADDFGLTKGVNRAIAELHRAGSLASATLMASGAAFEDAVEVARQNPDLDVGCHVVLLDGQSVSRPSEVPTLLERDTSANTFQASLGRFALALYSGKIREEDIEREAVAQIRKLQQAGVRVTHLDTHKHTHMFPRVLRPLLRAAATTGVCAIRNPFEARDRTARRNLLPGLHGAKTPFKRGLQVGILSAMRSTFQKMVRNAAIRTTDGALGVIVTGSLSFEERLAEILARLPQGTWELVCHPGFTDAELDSVKTRLRASREVEVAALKKLISPSLLAASGIVLSDFEDLNPESPPRIKRLHTTATHAGRAAK